MARKKRRRGIPMARTRDTRAPEAGRYGIPAFKPGHARRTRTQAVARITDTSHMPPDAVIHGRIIGVNVDIRRADYTLPQ